MKWLESVWMKTVQFWFKLTSGLRFEALTQKPTDQHWGWQTLSAQFQCQWGVWPLEDNVAVTVCVQHCRGSSLVKMLIKVEDRWRSGCSSNEHVPGKLSDWFLSEKGRFRATGRGNEAIFVTLWSIYTVRLLLWLQGETETANPSLLTESAIFWPYRHFHCHSVSEHFFLCSFPSDLHSYMWCAYRVTFVHFLLWVPIPHFHGNKG